MAFTSGSVALNSPIMLPIGRFSGKVRGAVELRSVGEVFKKSEMSKTYAAPAAFMISGSDHDAPTARKFPEIETAPPNSSLGALSLAVIFERKVVLPSFCNR